jgi:hypothetical protein
VPTRIYRPIAACVLPSDGTKRIDPGSRYPSITLSFQDYRPTWAGHVYVYLESICSMALAKRLTASQEGSDLRAD